MSDVLDFCRKHMTSKQWQAWLDSDEYLWYQVGRKGIWSKEMTEILDRDAVRYGDRKTFSDDRAAETREEAAKGGEGLKDVLLGHTFRGNQILQFTNDKEGSRREGKAAVSVNGSGDEMAVLSGGRL
jgi:hypothetical protein